LLCAELPAETSLETAQRAQYLLGPETWSRVITVRNETWSGRYPRTVHALVFEVAGMLWFYTDSEGTQSFSLYVGQLEREKSDFGPLLREIEPGFVQWTVEPAPPRAANRRAHSLPNGCFIESIVALRERIRAGGNVEEPRLLSYYVTTPVGRKGHTVLTYQTDRALEVFDPDRRDERLVFSKPIASDALKLARALHGGDVVKARYVRLDSELSQRDIAAAGRGRSAAEKAST
jgi:hypothetical protein